MNRERGGWGGWGEKSERSEEMGGGALCSFLAIAYSDCLDGISGGPRSGIHKARTS